MKRLVILLCAVVGGLTWPGTATGDNLRMSEPKIVGTDGNTTEVEVKLTWNNSWRDKCNFDAVYLFGKFRDRPIEGWHHIFWATNATLHTASTGYSLSVMNGGRGVVVYRTAEGAGPAEVTLRLKWQLNGNTAFPVAYNRVQNGDVPYSLQAIEMVYVPTAPFYVGDGVSSNAFSSAFFGGIPPEYDILRSNLFTYSANSESNRANFAADRVNQGVYHSNNRRDWCGTVFPAYWQVDFGRAKKILYFGVSGVFGERYNAGPAGTWYLEGSMDNATWSEVWSGGPENWVESSESYPVQKALRVAMPGSYRYYRIRVNATKNAGVWNNIRISNVAMTEVDLATVAPSGPIMVDGLAMQLPTAYPNGTRGFYAMKYELTQEQYVTFLNQLPRPAQYSRTIGGYLDKLKEGEYVFGDGGTTPSHRNGIIMHERNLNSGLPYVFGCDLSKADLPNGPADGQTVACNYLTPADLISYAEWSGMRPLSETEYEKMCRGRYPSLPTQGEYAWEGTDITKLTGISNSGGENELFQGNNANVNADRAVDGPVRVGIFARGNRRSLTGISFFGLSNLSDNVNEIYVDALTYGRQLKIGVHGSGEIADIGDARVADTDWPRRGDAYGVRGGDWNSDFAKARVSDRSRMTGYLTAMDDRHPETGFRLGITQAPENVVSKLTLENGLSTGATIPYDTVCNDAVYTIRGDLPVDDATPCHFSWTVSKDDGVTWERIPNSNRKNLEITNLQDGLPDMVVRVYRYKRHIFTPLQEGESGEARLVIGHGYSVSRIRDTMQPCMASKGFEVRTPLPAHFRWFCMDTRTDMHATRETATTSFYQPATADMKVNGRLDGGEYRIELTVTQAGGCERRQELQILVQPWTAEPWTSNESFHVDAAHSDQDFRDITTKWGGVDKQSWGLSSTAAELKINPNTGQITGMAQTMCNITVTLTCADFPDRVYAKQIKEDYRDWYFLEPGAERALKLLPGRYHMECWGTEGGSFASNAPGGYGGKAWGDLELNYVQTFHIYVGRQAYNDPRKGGYNGGAGSEEATLSAAGGGATDIRLVGGAWNNAASLQSRIMVAGGGGASGHSGRGGVGGGLKGGDGRRENGNNYVSAVGGSQTAAGFRGGFGYGGLGYKHGGGGGGGYYGGGGGGTACASENCCSNGAGGGSGYVSGLSGCTAHSSGIVFTNCGMSSGVCRGNGYVRIELLD